ncbi:hypothetical protein THAOC_03330 [Thalassiosira oceanica]|uniref:Uncharacterized protein n=1 Tax=Thalassiosira oceanica TaxID=159749 RepID=K0TPV6_THAOC|nr:hypothetical protein THAOC_03330 [Thalassiosira oceanica]|mmetsp:Transcript_30014/g.71401  ORF Transcript_30014/g.71401 Transcript_30014/m.71401 type:complete len:347 (+) Transcript_30014:150-1190(+)|eukprot:EJK74962.1 hypothetical protein THAOC_03330 [Thalassiosira oceanica]
MDSLLSGLIDCVARPSTTDTPVRVIRKCPSESPTCISALVGEAEGNGPEMPLPALSTSLENNTNSIDTESTRSGSNPPATPNQNDRQSSDSLVRMTGSTSLNSVLTAEGLLFDDARNNFASCVSCGDCSQFYGDTIASQPLSCDGEDNVDDSSVDVTVISNFEAAFTTFLYKNPTFQNMSYRSLQKIRQRLLKESVQNARAEKELRQQLTQLRESKRSTELELQKELLVIVRSRTERETLLRRQITKARADCLKLDGQLLRTAGVGSLTSSPSTPVHSSVQTSSTEQGSPCSPHGAESPVIECLKFDELPSKMEQAHILAEIEKLKVEIANDSMAIACHEAAFAHE